MGYNEPVWAEVCLTGFSVHSSVPNFIKIYITIMGDETCRLMDRQTLSPHYV